MNAFLSVYFAFTTLSTVGFGDFHPRSDTERLYCTVIFVFGICYFTYVMGEFIIIVERFQNMNVEFDANEELNNFFSLLRNFNNDLDIDPELRESISNYIIYQ